MEGTKKELMDLFEANVNSRDASKLFIDQIISEKRLHRFKDSEVVEVAYEKGCLISRCLHHPQRYKANGIWLEPGQELSAKLDRYPNLTANYCNLDNPAEIRAQYLAAYQNYKN